MVCQGKSVFSGISIGRIAVLKKDDQSVKMAYVEDVEQELKRVGETKEKAIAQLIEI